MTRGSVVGAFCTVLLLCGGAQAARQTATSAAPEDTLPLNYKPPPDSDEAGLWMISDEMEKNFQSSPLLVRAPELNAHVREIVCKLAPDRCASIRIYILDIPRFNAAMSPNGALQVWTGLLLRVQSDAQLGVVLGHEITHYTLRHTVNQWRRVRSASGTVAFLSIATAGVGGLIAGLAAVESLLSYSRDEEREADAGGLRLAAAAGYDPAQAAALWRAELAEEQADPNRDKGFAFTRTHPTSEERLATMQRRATELKTDGSVWNLGYEDYRKTVAPYRRAWLAEDVALGHYEQSLILLNRLIADEPNSGELQFFLGEVYRRHNAQGDGEKALAAYRAAIADGGAPAAAYRGIGLIAMKSGDKETARAAFQKYLDTAPSDGDGDRAMVEYYLSHL